MLKLADLFGSIDIDADIDANGEKNTGIVVEGKLEVVVEWETDVEGVGDLELLGSNEGAPEPEPMLKRQRTEICAAPFLFLIRTFMRPLLSGNTFEKLRKSARPHPTFSNTSVVGKLVLSTVIVIVRIPVAHFVNWAKPRDSEKVALDTRNAGRMENATVLPTRRV